MLLLPENGSIAVKAGYPPEDTLDDADLAAAKWAWENDRAAGRGSDTLPGAKRLFLPMHTGRGADRRRRHRQRQAGPLLTPDQRRLLDALIDQGALAIERVRLVEDIDRVKRTAETDRLRSALLTSISHDLKTPLAAVLGSAGTLRELVGQARRSGESRSPGHDHRRIRAAQPLHRQPARHDQAGVRRRRAECAPCTISARSSAARCARAARFSRNTMSSSISRPDLPMVELDPVLFEQVLFNLLDNAAKYAPPGTTIRIQRRGAKPNSVCVRVFDEGDGIPQDDLERIFDKFYRAQKGDHVRAGTGLGLAISRGFVEAHARHDRRGKPHRPHRRGLHYHACRCLGQCAQAGYGRMTAAPLKVLVIDDEPPIRKLLRMGLTAQGYQIPKQANGKTALELMSEAPDLIILDLGLPDIQGHELLRTIRCAQ